LKDVRNVFDKYNLISALHTFYSKKDKIYKNILPPLSLLNKIDEEDLLNNLKKIDFKSDSQLAA
jgi:4-hydroxy-tetrahydrodipicolinate synthase